VGFSSGRGAFANETEVAENKKFSRESSNNIGQWEKARKKRRGDIYIKRRNVGCSNSQSGVGCVKVRQEWNVCAPMKGRDRDQNVKKGTHFQKTSAPGGEPNTKLKRRPHVMHSKACCGKKERRLNMCKGNANKRDSRKKINIVGRGGGFQKGVGGKRDR